MDIPKIGLWAHGMDVMLLQDEIKGDHYYFFALSGSMLEAYLRKNMKAENIVVIHQTLSPEVPAVTFQEMIDKTDFTSVLKEKQIYYFVNPHSVKPAHEEWAKLNSIHLIEPPFEIARLFDTKIEFNQYLSEYGIPAPPSYSVKECLEMKGSEKKQFVVQESNNFGLYGTQFFSSVSSMKNYLSSLQINSHLLIREFLRGPAFGIGLFMDRKGSYFYSACRKQCYHLDENGFPLKFLGIQWVPYDFFDDEFHTNFNPVLKGLAEMFRLSGYYGNGNIDLIISDNRPYFLECNARLSSASAQLFGHPELTGGINSWDFFIRSFFGMTPRPIEQPYVPRSNFCGSALDIYRKDETHLKKLPLIGTYALEGREIHFLGEFAKLQAKDEKRFFITHDFAQEPQTQQDFILGSLFSDFPVFDFATGELNEDGQRIEEYFWTESL